MIITLKISTFSFQKKKCYSRPLFFVKLLIKMIYLFQTKELKRWLQNLFLFCFVTTGLLTLFHGCFTGFDSNISFMSSYMSIEMCSKFCDEQHYTWAATSVGHFILICSHASLYPYVSHDHLHIHIDLDINQ